MKNSSKLPLKSSHLHSVIRRQQKTDSALIEKRLAAPPECKWKAGSKGWNNYNELFAVLLGWEVFVAVLF